MKTLRLKDTKEYVVLEASIPEGYGTSQCPQILADTADFEGLKHCCPLVDFSNMELVDVYIRVKCNDKLKVNQTVQPEEDFHCRPDYDQPTHPAPPPQSDKMGVARETEKLLILVKKYRDTMYLEEEVAKYLTEFASRNSAPVDAEEFLYKTLCDFEDESGQYWRGDSVIKLLTDFASRNVVTDEEIEAMAEEWDLNDPLVRTEKYSFIEGAKAMRKKMEGTEL